MALQRVGEMMTQEQLASIQEKCALYAQGAKPVYETEAEMQARYAAQITARKIAFAKKESEVGTKFEAVTFAEISVDASNATAFEMAVAIVNSNGKRGLGVHGAPGVGKSMLIAATVNALRDSGVVGVCVSAPSLMLKFREGFDLDGSPSESSIVRKLSGVPVLAVQDLGKEQFTPYSLQMLHAIFDARWENNLPLLVTSNMSPAALIMHYSNAPSKGATMDRSTGPAMIDRVMDMTNSPWVQITGLSRRGAA